MLDWSLRLILQGLLIQLLLGTLSGLVRVLGDICSNILGTAKEAVELRVGSVGSLIPIV